MPQSLQFSVVEYYEYDFKGPLGESTEVIVQRVL